MSRTPAIEITSELAIPGEELRFVASRAAGPGGQHVNKVSSRVSLLFDVAASRALDDGQKRRVLSRLATRIGRDGVLRLSAQRHRSQAANREAVRERFAELLRDALRPRTPRRPTRVPNAERRRRLDDKRRRAELKRGRSGPEGDRG